MSLYEKQLRKEAETVPCTYCRADIGQQCTSLIPGHIGEPVRIPHYYRTKAARAADSEAAS